MRFAKTGHAFRFLGTVSVATASLLTVGPAMAADQPKIPEQVAAYFEDGLIPRLIDLYGSVDGTNTGIDFDATTTVGPISRVLEWTLDFLAGKQTDSPTQLTNNWVASVSVRDDLIGLATVWINPSSDEPELATFDPPQLARALAAAPAQSLLVNDHAHSAWFAIDADALTPLVAGISGVTAQTTPDAYQRSIATVTSPAVPDGAPSGLAVAAIVLGVVILALAVFILLPDSRRRKQTEAEAPEAKEPEPAPKPAPEPAAEKPKPKPKPKAKAKAKKPVTK